MIHKLIALIIASSVLGQASWNDPRFIAFRDSINNNPASTWKAEVHASIPYGDPAKLQALLGAKLGSGNPNEYTSDNNPFPGAKGRRLAVLPTNFDLRTGNGACWSIGYIRDQSKCGSCWSVAGNAALSDNYCLYYKRKGITKPRSFSYEDTLENCSLSDCGSGPNDGCNGGYVSGAFTFAKNVGTVTGENYGNYTSCKPYLISPSATSATSPPPVKFCNSQSKAYYGKSLSESSALYNADKLKIAGAVRITGSSDSVRAQNAMNAIYTYGSLVAGFTVYYDFYYYKTGVYQSNLKNVQGGHAVRVIGWGTDPDTGLDYWLAANQWGSKWGAAGLFKIRRGVNHCGFEAWMYYPIIA